VPSRKQRRRRAKERRHEYEYVFVDEEGREVEVDEAELQAGRTAKKAGPARDQKGRPVRTVDPPSWNRVGKRALVFAPFMFVVVYLLRPESAGVPTVIVQVLVLLAFFLPFSYLMDSIVYRTYLRRTGRAAKTARE
jgi:hypothetical protein